MDVAAVGPRQRRSAQPAAHHGEPGVEEHVRQREDRDERVEHAVGARRPSDGEECEQETNDKAAGITEEDASRWPVVVQESDERASERERL